MMIDCMIKLKHQILFPSSNELFYPYTRNDLSKQLNIPFQLNFEFLGVLGTFLDLEYEHNSLTNTSNNELSSK